MKTGVIPESFVISPMAQAIGAMYRAGADLHGYVLRHIDDLKSSEDEVITGAGRVLDQALKGLQLGFAAPVVIIVVGQLLLGNPLTAVVSGIAMAFSPVAMTCAAIGAIYMGWRALSAKDRAKLLEAASAGLSVAADILISVVEFALTTAQAIFGSSHVAALKRVVMSEAANFGRGLGKVTGSLLDYTADWLPQKAPTPRGSNDALVEVLEAMSREEAVTLLQKTLGRTGNTDDFHDAGLRRQVAEALSDAASRSWPLAKRPTYPEAVAMVAKRLKLPSPASVDVREVERVILFKLLELSLERLKDGERVRLVDNVEEQLRQRGIKGRVSFDEIAKFVKIGAIDAGGTLGGLVFAAPGMYGVVGLNFLQFAILKGIIFTSGYFAAGTALLGFGTGGVMLAVAGWAGPIGAGLAVLYAAHSIAGPAYRKLVPAVCLIAAKRLEMTQLSPD